MSVSHDGGRGDTDAAGEGRVASAASFLSGSVDVACGDGEASGDGDGVTLQQVSAPRERNTTDGPSDGTMPKCHKKHPPVKRFVAGSHIE